MGGVVSKITDAVGLTSVAKDKKRAKRQLADQQKLTEAAERRQATENRSLIASAQEDASVASANRQGGAGSFLSLLGGAFGTRKKGTAKKPSLLGSG